MDKNERLNILDEVFTPSAPIERKALFAGRIPQLQQVYDGILEKGQHIILYGERGVGKTSLANIIQENFFEIYKAIYVKLTCNNADTFKDIWHKICNRVELLRMDPRAGFKSKDELVPIQLSMFNEAHKEIKSEDIVFVFKQVIHPCVVILDEFDRVQSRRVRIDIADTLKALSDNISNVTVIIVGVSESVTDLLGEHRSIERSVRQIQIPKMSQDEILEIVDKGMKRLKMNTEIDFRNNLVKFSSGFPHYAHLISKYAAKAAINDDRDLITLKDFDIAITEAIANAQEGLRTAYQKAIMSAKKETLFVPVLFSCALVHVDENDSFRATDLIETLEKIRGIKPDYRQYIYHLGKLTENERGSILSRIGTKNRYRYKFKNPLMKAYVLMKAYKKGFTEATTALGC